MFAVTERLLLRPGWVDDAPALHAAIAHPEIATRLARLPWPYTLDHARDYLRQERGADDIACLITLRHGDAARIIGAVGLHSTEEGELELGYWLAPDCWGRGYATEAAAALVANARDSLRRPRLVSGHFADNPASGRVLAKLGFRVTGHELRPCFAAGESKECVLMALDFADASAR